MPSTEKSMWEAWTVGWWRRGDVVPVEGDVDVTERDRLADELGDQVTNALCEECAAPMDPDDREPGSARLLDDLVRDAHERAPHVLGVEDDLVAHFGSFLASPDRVKGAVGASVAPAYGGTVSKGVRHL